MAHPRLKGARYVDHLIAKTFDLNGTPITSPTVNTPVAVHNATGGTLTAGTLVFLSGWNSSAAKFNVTKADADGGAGIDRATLIINADILNGADGYAQQAYALTAQNTNSASAVGDPVYLSTTAGGWTLTAPTAPTAQQQIVGYVGVKSTTVGIVQFNLFGAPVVKLGSNDLQLGATQLKWTYDATVQLGTQGTRAMIGPALPVGFQVVAGLLRVITSPVGVGASIAIQLQAANDVITAAAISGAPWSTTGNKAIIPVWSDMTKTVSVASSAKTPSLIITTADLSACVLNLFLVGFPADS